MGKRSDGQFKRIARDYYPTPEKAILPLLPFLSDVDGFAEPCVGDGHLARGLEKFGHECRWALDIEPGMNALADYSADWMPVEEITGEEMALWIVTHFITNPPWPGRSGNGEPTMQIIRHLAAIRPTWLLLSADFKHNDYAAEVMAYCHKVVSIGRVKWIEESKHQGVDNAAWYLFDRNAEFHGTFFHPRAGRRAVFAREIEALV